MKALKDFGIKLNWKFDFRAHGSTLEPLPNTLFVDVGNKLTEGIIDTHHGTNFNSTADALQKRPELVLNHFLMGINQAYARGEADRLRAVNEIELTFVTHNAPDWDSVAAFFLCDHLVRTGEFPEKHGLLVEATNEIDQGRAKMAGMVKRPFMIYYDLSDGKRLDWQEQLTLGRDLIEDIFRAIKNKELTCTGNPFLDSFEDLENCLPKYREHISRLEADKKNFEKDLEMSEIWDVELPHKKSGIGREFEETTALVFREEPTCKLHKYWVRDKGETPSEPQLLLIPYNFHDSDQIKGWIISVDPNKRHCLRRLGYCLEQMETEKRGEKHKRSGEPRWGEADYSDNFDPWYDGRDHDFTIVAGPAAGTKLDLADIKQVLEQRFHGIRLEKSPNNKLAFYFFFEIPEMHGKKKKTREDLRRFLSEAKLDEIRVLENLDRAFEFIKMINLWSMECPHDEDDGFKATLWASEITRHCVLQLQVKDFQKTVGAHAQILEDLAEAVEKIENQAGKTAEKIRDTLKLERKIWGLECFRLLELNQPDLRFHSKEKVQNVFDTLLRDRLPREKIDWLIKGEGIEQIRTSHALCILNKARHDGDEAEPSQRQIMLFYSLFLKTGYRNFSARIGGIVDVIIDPKGPEYEKGIKEIQEDYSAFLGRYEFSEREINTDNGLQDFFKSALNAMGFQEQREETRHEMQTTFELAAAKNRKTIENGNRILNCLILGLGVLALGDFGYAWWTGQNEEITIGLYVLGGLTIIAIIAVLLLSKFIGRHRR